MNLGMRPETQKYLRFNGGIQCPYCKYYFKMLGRHLFLKHNMTALEFKRKNGLLRKEKILWKKTQELFSNRSKKMFQNKEYKKRMIYLCKKIQPMANKVSHILAEKDRKRRGILILKYRTNPWKRNEECKNGHPLTGEGNRRHCLICKLKKYKEWRLKNKKHLSEWNKENYKKRKLDPIFLKNRIKWRKKYRENLKNKNLNREEVKL